MTKSMRLYHARLKLWIWLGRNSKHPKFQQVYNFVPELTGKINTARFWESWISI